MAEEERLVLPVEGIWVPARGDVDLGEVLGADVGALTRGVQRAGERVWSRWSSGDWAGRSLEEVAPQTYADYDA